MSRRFTLQCHPYSDRLDVLVGDAAEGAKWLQRQGSEADTCEDSLGMSYIPDDDESLPICMWLAADAPQSMMAHELVHVAMAVLHRAGVPISYANDEALAYLVSHLFKTLQARLAKAPRARKTPKPPVDLPPTT